VSTRIVAAIVLVGILFAAAVYNIRARQSPPDGKGTGASSRSLAGESPVAVSTERVRLGSIAETIRAVGVVRSDRQAAITARAPGRIADIPVREGSRVTAGQVLVRLDLEGAPAQISGAEAGVDAARAQLRKAADGRRAKQVELDSQVGQARTGLDNAKVKLQQAELGAKLQEASTRSDSDRARAAVLQAEAGLKQAELAVDQAEKTLKRVEFLYSRGGVPRVEVDGARSQVDIARAQREGAVAAVRQAQAAEKPAAETGPLRERVSRQDIEAAQLGVRNAEDSLKTAQRARTESLLIADRDIEAARAALRQAEAGRQGVAVQVGGSTLTSPIAGIVTQLNAHAGEFAQPGLPLMTVVSTDAVFIEASVPSRYASMVSPGTAAQIMTASEASPLAGRVSEVLPVGLDDGRTVPVRIRISSSRVRLSPGLSVTVTLSTVAGRPLPVVPNGAILFGGDKSYVLVYADGIARRREVRTGAADGERVTVHSGLTEADIVITEGPSSLSDGARVTLKTGAP
jgi:HlyD family secretion protein